MAPNLPYKITVKTKHDYICEEYSSTCKLFKIAIHMLGGTDKMLEKWGKCGNAMAKSPLKAFAAHL